MSEWSHLHPLISLPESGLSLLYVGLLLVDILDLVQSIVILATFSAIQADGTTLFMNCLSFNVYCGSEVSRALHCGLIGCRSWSI